MKAVRIHAYGGPTALQYEEVPLPEPGDDDVLVKVHAASVNPVDKIIRAGYLQAMMQYQLPLTLGQDLAGEVAAAGSQVTDLNIGDAVYGFASLMRPGSYAEYAVIAASQLAPKPKSLDYVNAAAVPLAALSALQSLDAAGLQAGQTVLVHGAGGGVGSFAVQLAKARGAHVLATASTAKLPLLRELGADEAIDYTTTRFEDVAQNVDVVLDTIGGDVIARSWAVLKPGGVLVSLVDPNPTAPEGSQVRGLGNFANSNTADLTRLAALIDGGQVKVIVSAVLPLADACTAHEMLESGHVRGKIVLSVIG